MSETSIAHETRLTTLEVILRELQKLNSDHEKRIRTVERTLGYGSGAIGMLLFLGKAFKFL